MKVKNPKMNELYKSYNEKNTFLRTKFNLNFIGYYVFSIDNLKRNSKRLFDCEFFLRLKIFNLVFVKGKNNKC